MPDSRQRSRSPLMALAVMARIGTRTSPPAASRSRIRRVAWKPSISGIWQSMRMMS